METEGLVRQELQKKNVDCDVRHNLEYQNSEVMKRSDGLKATHRVTCKGRTAEGKNNVQSNTNL